MEKGTLTFADASHPQDQAVHFPFPPNNACSSGSQARKASATQLPLHKHQHCPAA